MKPSTISVILANHCKWLASEPGGEKANLRVANLSGANLNHANLNHANLPCVEVMPKLAAKIVASIDGGSLNMVTWHICETVHCLGGWATTLHPQGKLLESMIGTNAAAALIFNACCGEVPDFYSSDDVAREWITKHANPT